MRCTVADAVVTDKSLAALPPGPRFLEVSEYSLTDRRRLVSAHFPMRRGMMFA